MLLRALKTRLRNRLGGVSKDLKGYLGLILGLYWDNGKENGNYYLGFRVLDLLCLGCT